MKNSLFVSVALLALLAVPALAQQHEEHNAGRGRESGAAHSQARPAARPNNNVARPAARPNNAAPRPATRPTNNVARPGNNAAVQRPHGNQPIPAPTALPPGMRPGQDSQGYRPGNNRPGGDNHRPGNNNRPGDNRPGFSGNGHRPGGDMRPGGRPDYSHFRDYHRSFQASRRFHAGSYRRPSGWYYRRWTYGQTLPSLFWGQNYWLNDYIDYDLPPPPPGAVWVRYGDDALLIDRYSGEIISAQYGVFY